MSVLVVATFAFVALQAAVSIVLWRTAQRTDVAVAGVASAVGKLNADVRVAHCACVLVDRVETRGLRSDGVLQAETIVVITLRNAGDSPAYDLEGTWFVGTSDDRAIAAEPLGAVTLGAGSRITVRFPTLKALRHPDVRELRAGELRVWGTLIYRDAFGMHRRTEAAGGWHHGEGFAIDANNTKALAAAALAVDR